MEEIVEKLEEVIIKNAQQLKKELKEELKKELKEELKQELTSEINQQMDKRFDKIQEEIKQIHNQQIVFEHEYGTKIDAIFDAITMELDKNLEKTEKIRKLSRRIEKNEVTIFNHEKRI